MSTLTPARAIRAVARSNFYFDTVSDPRAYRGTKQQPLPAVMRLMVAAFASGKMVLRAIEDFSEDLPKATAKHMGLTKAVSDTTQYELLKRTDPEGMRETLWRSMRRDIDSKAITNDSFPRGAVSYDGKGAGSGWGEAPNDACRESVCDAEGTAFWDFFALRACLVSSSARPVIDQELIPSKKGEATTFPDMFERDVVRFPKLFRYVLGDAGLASSRNAQKVLEHRKVYLFQIKSNFSQLYPMALNALSCATAVATTTERYQGTEVRRELRRVATPAEISFPGATQLLSIRQTRTDPDGERSVEERVFITAIPWHELKPSALLRLVRLHWGIENGANWTADMILQEDSRRPCNQGFGPNVCSWLLLLAYNMVSVFRGHLPKKDRHLQRWERARELLYQAFLTIPRAGSRLEGQVTIA